MIGRIAHIRVIHDGFGGRGRRRHGTQGTMLGCYCIKTVNGGGAHGAINVSEEQTAHDRSNGEVT